MIEPTVYNIAGTVWLGGFVLLSSALVLWNIFADEFEQFSWGFFLAAAGWPLVVAGVIAIVLVGTLVGLMEEDEP